MQPRTSRPELKYGKMFRKTLVFLSSPADQVGELLDLRRWVHFDQVVLLVPAEGHRGGPRLEIRTPGERRVKNDAHTMFFQNEIVKFLHFTIVEKFMLLFFVKLW